MATTTKRKQVAAKPAKKAIKGIKKISGVNYAPVKCSMSKGEAVTKAEKIRTKGHSARVIKKKSGDYCVYTPESAVINGTKPKKSKVAAKPKAAKPKAAKATKAKVAAKKKATKAKVGKPKRA